MKRVVVSVAVVAVLVVAAFMAGLWSSERTEVKSTHPPAATATATPKDGEPTRTVKVPIDERQHPTKLPQVFTRTRDTRTQLSEFVTYYPPAQYRNINQGLAANNITGTLIKPGEVFSFNQSVGERTAEAGFVKGWIISNGVFKESLGGGVSQVATTVYNAALKAGMTIVERHAHSLYLDRYPIGRDATVAWPESDLQFRNDSEYPVRIEAWVVPSGVTSYGAMHVRMWSTKKTWDIRFITGLPYNYAPFSKIYVGKNSGIEPMDGSRGFDIDVVRKFYRSGVLDHEETIFTRYLPTDKVLVGRPPATPTSTPSPSTTISPSE